MQKLACTLFASLLALAMATTAHAQGTLPVGTAITVTLDQGISSKDAQVGQAVNGTVTSDVTANGRVVIPKHSTAMMHVASVKASGRLSTPGELYLSLDRITVNGRTYTITAHWAGGKAGSHVKRNTVAIGGGTAAGAIIGGLAGGGKGAAIGAAVGAGAGTAGAAATGKKDISFAAEDKLSFRIKTALRIK